MLDDEANTCKAVYGNDNNARLALSYISMAPDIFEPGNKIKVEGHPSPATDAVSNWESSGAQRVFRDEVEDIITDIEKARFRRIEMHLMHLVHLSPPVCSRQC
jgi:hypothetical protein